MELDMFTIGDLSREFGVTLRTLRFYEDKGLLNPKRQGTTRLYDRRDRARLKLVLLGKRIGLSLVEIKDILDLYDLGDNQETQFRVAMEKFEAQIKILEQQKAEIEQAIDELTDTMVFVSRKLQQREADDQPQAEAC